MSEFGIIGYGFVGQATHKGLLNYQSVVKHDVKYNTDVSTLKDCSIVFCCLPTDDFDDIQILLHELSCLKKVNPLVSIILRSTVPIGSCKLIEDTIRSPIIYIPEFLRERFWEDDCLNRPIIIGNNSAKLPDFLESMENRKCSLEEAEILKMFSNNFAVLRIAYANIFYEVCENKSADYKLVKDLYHTVANDQTYLDIPGPDNKRGFGGKCLPKDLDFLIETLENMNIDSEIFNNIRNQNKIWVRKF